MSGSAAATDSPGTAARCRRRWSARRTERSVAGVGHRLIGQVTKDTFVMFSPWPGNLPEPRGDVGVGAGDIYTRRVQIGLQRRRPAHSCSAATGRMAVTRPDAFGAAPGAGPDADGAPGLAAPAEDDAGACAAATTPAGNRHRVGVHRRDVEVWFGIGHAGRRAQPSGGGLGATAGDVHDVDAG